MLRKFILRVAALAAVTFAASSAVAAPADFKGDFRFFIGQQPYELSLVPGSYTANQATLTDANLNEVWGSQTGFVESLTNRLVRALNNSTLDTATATTFDATDFLYANVFVFANRTDTAGNLVRGRAVVNNGQSATGTWENVGFSQSVNDTSFAKFASNYDIVFLTAVAVPEINGSVFAQLGLVAGGGYIALRRRRKSAPAAA